MRASTGSSGIRGGTRLLAVAVITPIVVFASCSDRQNEVTYQDPITFEFEYEVTESSGTCDTLFPADEIGVLALMYEPNETSVCMTSELCEIEVCHVGAVFEEAFYSNNIHALVPDPEGDCRYWVEVDFDLVEQPDGSMQATTRHSLTYDSGDCDELLTLPCERTQTLRADLCEPGCYLAQCVGAP